MSRQLWCLSPFPAQRVKEESGRKIDGRKMVGTWSGYFCHQFFCPYSTGGQVLIFNFSQRMNRRPWLALCGSTSETACITSPVAAASDGPSVWRFGPPNKRWAGSAHFSAASAWQPSSRRLPRRKVTPNGLALESASGTASEYLPRSRKAQHKLNVKT